jgi:hypothetical protein
MAPEYQQPWNLFDIPSNQVSRTTDPQTSHDAAAARRPEIGSHRRRLLIWFAAAGDAGLTADEAADKADLLHVGYWKRVSDLKNQRYIRATGEKRPGRSGQLQQVYAITHGGRWALGGEHE